MKPFTFTLQCFIMYQNPSEKWVSITHYCSCIRLFPSTLSVVHVRSILSVAHFTDIDTHTHTPNDWCSTAINFLFSDHKTIAFYKPSVANKQSSLIHSDGFWQNIIMNRRKISVRVATTGAEKKKIITLKSKPATVRVDGNENGK